MNDEWYLKEKFFLYSFVVTNSKKSKTKKKYCNLLVKFLKNKFSFIIF